MKLALFFTCGMSLEKWDRIGSLSREIKPYQVLAKQLDQVYFFTYGSQKDLEFARQIGEKIIVLPNKWKIPSCLYGFLMPFVYWKVLKNIDILKTNQMASAIPAVISRLLFKKRLIIRSGYEWLNVLIKEKKSQWKKIIVFIWEKVAYKAADIVVFTSQKDLDFAKQKFSIPQRKVRLIPNFIDTSIFKPFSIAKQIKTVVYVGRLAKEKNLFNLIEAISELKLKLVLIGKGPQENDLKIFAKEKNANVEFLGAVANERLPEILNQFSIFVLPSFYEGSPKALLEAMACGLVCLACNVEGIKEIINHKENGYLCQTNSQSIKSSLSELLNDQALQNKISQNARETILEKFCLEKIIEQEIALYLNLRVLVLAGGKGMRLWPLSRNDKPKQFQKLTSTKTMLQETIWRLIPDISWQDIFVSTNIQYQDEVLGEVPKIPKENVIIEPMSRERMASLLLFLANLPKEFYNKPILVLPSDHLIKKIDLFKQAVFVGENFIKKNPDYILMLGAKPTFSDTGLGYVKKGRIISKSNFNIFQTEAFVEKPNLQRANEFLQQGDYVWNTAIYIFTPTLILEQIKKFVPDNYQRFLNIQRAVGSLNFKAVLEKEYSRMDQVPLEFSVLENYDKVAVLEIEMGWSDVGSWSVLKGCLANGNQNFAKGNHIDLDSENVMVYGANNKQLVATVGVKDLIVVITDDIILVCNKNESQKVKQLAATLEKEQKFKYL
ncbi:MAG: glycosyltransferase [Candidatus Pacebacteria bacterium]|nr:glycosyltransferase [Candidatus Paceibacterota bacterium]